MPQRSLPKSATGRLKALHQGKLRKDSLPLPLIIPYSSGTITRLDMFYPAYKLKVEAKQAALQAQTYLSILISEKRQMARLNTNHFFQAMQNAVRRKIFKPSVRTFYGLPASSGSVPIMRSEADIEFWGDKAATGEAARIAAGGVPITFPSIAEVTAAVTDFKNANLLQANAKEAFDLAQEAVEADTSKCDKLILKMWNETETAFDEGNKPSTRRKAREWGVVYVPNPGEAASSDDFSIMGTVTDSATGNPIADARVTLTNTDVVEKTDAQGKYLIAVQPPGVYNLKIYKNGYALKDVSNISITEDAITTVNAALLPVG